MMTKSNVIMADNDRDVSFVGGLAVMINGVGFGWA